MEQKHDNFEFKELNRIAQNTKNKIETLSETVCLYRRDLLDSFNYSVVCVPLYSDLTIKNAIENVTLFSYLKSRYNCKIIVCADLSKNKFIHIYSLFNNYYDIIVDCPRYFDIHNCLEDKRVTKIIYHDTIDLLDNFDYYSCPISVNMDSLLYRPEVYPKNNKLYDFCVSAKLKSDIEPFDRKLYIDVSTCGNLYSKINAAISSKYYVNIGNSSDIDYIVPFLGSEILFYKTIFYSQRMFAHSLSKRNNLIKHENIK